MAEKNPRSGTGGGLSRLPPGRHGLSREYVAENQKRRIASGVIRAVVERGYAAASVAHVTAAAGVSRRTFYNYYGDKQEAFFDVYAQVTDFLCEAMKEAGEAEKGWVARVKAELAALLDCFAANPDLVRFCFVVPPAAGGAVAASYRDFLERLLALLCTARPKRTRRPPPAAEFGLLGGLTGLVVATVEEHGAQGLETLLPEVVELVLTPYLGRDAAVQAAR